VGGVRADLVRSPAFLAGTLVRLLCLAALAPTIHLNWFAPFLAAVPTAPSADVWTAFLAQGGDVRAFPYGLPYMLVFGPPVWIAQALSGWAQFADAARLESAGLGLMALALDVLLLLALIRWTGRVREVIWAYWLSPLVIFINYWHGQLDVLPTLLLVAAVSAVATRYVSLGGALIGLAAAAKLSMLAAFPFFVIFLLRNRRRRGGLEKFLAIALVAFVALMLPIVLSEGARTMVLQTPEARKLYSLSIAIGDAIVFAAPLAYICVVYYFWNVHRISSQLFVNIVGIGFLPLLLLTPASPGWFMWLVPFLALHQIRGGRTAMILGLLFSVAVVVTNALTVEGPRDPFGRVLSGELVWQFVSGQAALIQNWLHTATAALGLLLGAQMLRDGVLRNLHYRLGRNRLVLGIAGDSGSGKDVLVNALSELFGRSAVTHISGDDYHNWDRKRQMWSVLTHLDPAANRLEEMTRDVLQLAAGGTVKKRHYDHETGLMSRPEEIRPSDVIIVSGLHALYPPQLRLRQNLRIFMDMDDALRRALKLHRDTGTRGHDAAAVLASLDRRAVDRQRFIQPQGKHADIVLSLAAASPRELERAQAGDENFGAVLTVTLDEGVSVEEFRRAVVATSALRIDVEHLVEPGRVRVILSGDSRSVDIRVLSRRIAADVDDYVELTHAWRPGWVGIMELFVVMILVERLRGDVSWR